MLTSQLNPNSEPAMQRICLYLAAALSSATAASEQYTPAEILDWQTQSFKGQTDYSLTGAEEAGADHAAVRASCSKATASGLVLEREHRLADAPILEWRWRVDAVYSGLDETSKGGDDYPARVYVVAERWPAFRSRAINYVWASSQPGGASWENAFASQFTVVAVRSGQERLGKWVTERRNVLEDFKRLHDLEPDNIDALAIMTDCDNAGQSATAWYGPIRWLGRENPGIRSSTGR
ncbi:DUF3047 domain-containing protein [Wenzhouxiangella sp. EGI_FJ10409]|uniref:DUF3047 domain-containing protein n=1 Tax=Wenzhouxiangella sp. EGI_FJ10409 TaxID=3243767 RepID=UPI0035DB4ACB